MKKSLKTLVRVLVIPGLFCSMLSNAYGADKTFIRVAAGSPGNHTYATVTHMVNSAQKMYDDLKFEVSSISGTKRTLMGAKGEIEVFNSVPIITGFLKDGVRMYKKIKTHEELYGNIRGILQYNGGPINFVTYEDTGIQSLEDLKGKKVFLGTKTGAINSMYRQIINGATGLEAGKDFKMLNVDNRSGFRAFQDRQVEAVLKVGMEPNPTIQQFSMGGKIRFIPITDEHMKSPQVQEVFNIPGNFEWFTQPGIYGDKQTNTEPVRALASVVGISVNKDVPEEVVYKMTKAFWENLDSLKKTAAWAEKNITREMAVYKMMVPLHPGAKRYYEEAGGFNLENR